MPVNIFEIDIAQILVESPDAKIVKIYLESDSEMSCKGITIHDSADDIIKLRNVPPPMEN